MLVWFLQFQDTAEKKSKPKQAKPKPDTTVAYFLSLVQVGHNPSAWREGVVSWLQYVAVEEKKENK